MGEKIFEEWRVYEKLLIHDYMDHKAFFGQLQQQVQQQYQRPISVLDLGCGDMTPILSLLQSVALKRYVGIDESAGALAIAQQRLTELHLPGELIEGDILASLQALQENFDLVVASFSLHHLSNTQDKLSVLRAIKRHLSDGGMFAMIDVFCHEQEPREIYVERWIRHADRRYQALQTEEKQLLFDHVRARDNPVSEHHWQLLGKQAGMERFEMVLRDRFEFNGLAIFS